MAHLKKKKGADDPPVNKNRSDSKGSKAPSKIVTEEKPAQKGKGKK